MVEILRILVAICAIRASSSAWRKQSIDTGETDKDQKYPYVVTFIRGNRRACTGTLLSANWVLTAGHCTFFEDEHRVQYGNLSVSPTQAKFFSKIIRAVKHPSQRSGGDAKYQFTNNDLQLVLVETIPMSRYGNISAIDYKTLLGRTVEFANLEVTYKDLIDVDKKRKPKKEIERTELRPLMLGQGIITSCDPKNYMGTNQDGPMVCVAPSCANRFLPSWSGDSGGPLFYEGKIIGVLLGAGNLPSSRYAAVSPFIDWMHMIMSKYTAEKF